eukprot:43060-Rhodomonas_salina.2
MVSLPPQPPRPRPPAFAAPQPDARFTEHFEVCTLHCARSTALRQTTNSRGGITTFTCNVQSLQEYVNSFCFNRQTVILQSTWPISRGASQQPREINLLPVFYTVTGSMTGRMERSVRESDAG